MIATEPVAAFRDAMRAAGMTPPDVVADGRLHRFHVEGDRSGSKNGWYALFPDDPPAGAYGCWRRNISETWCARSERTFTEAERTRFRTRMDEARKVREAEERRVRERAARKAREIWSRATPADAAHAYLRRKHVQPHGVRQLGDRLVVPVTLGGEIHGLQFIEADLSVEPGKRFLRGTPKRGRYFLMAEVNGRVAIAEGYATAASIAEATGLASVVAFDAGNLRPVAEEIRRRFPDVEILIAGDDDRATKGNPGRTCAEEAARAVGGRALVPEFLPGEAGSDFNDLAQLRGSQAVARAFDPEGSFLRALRAAPKKMVAVTSSQEAADKLAALEVIAVSAADWRASYTEGLKGRNVVLLPDHVQCPDVVRVGHALGGVASKVRVLKLDGGVVAWLDRGGTLEELRPLAREAHAWEPEEEPAHEPPAGPEPGPVAEPGAEPGPEVEPTGDDELVEAGRDHASTPTRTDTGNATRFVELHGSRLHYVAPWGRWLVCDRDGFWVEDHRDVHVRELAKDVGQRLKREAAKEPGEGEASKLFKFAFKSLNAAGISGMVDLARGIGDVPLDHELLDRDPWLLGVQDGVVDLRTGEHRHADPADLITRRCPVAYEPAAHAPRWERALEEWFPDEEVRTYVQRVAGSALVGLQRDHVFVIHYGLGGNGKGTFTRALQGVLGPYAVEIHLSLLVEMKHKEHDTVKADLFRARLAVAVETGHRVKLAEASVKNITGGDRIRARRMHQDPWAFDPTHSLWLQTNHLPEISGRDTGIWRRIRVVKWERTFTGREEDQTLGETLEAEAPGILRWLVQGCLEWQRHGLQEPEAVKRETLAYRRAEDTFSRFQESVGLVFRPELEIQAQELQDLLVEWANGEGTEPRRSEVGAWLLEQGAEQRRRKWTDPQGKRRQARFWVGVGLDDGNHESEQTHAL